MYIYFFRHFFRQQIAGLRCTLALKRGRVSAVGSGIAELLLRGISSSTSPFMVAMEAPDCAGGGKPEGWGWKSVFLDG
jgi:hypothetical protein